MSTPPDAALDLAGLTNIDDLLWYDGPQLSNVQDATGQTYLALLVSANYDTDTLLYAPITATRLAAVIDGTIPLRDAFTNADGQVWFVTKHYQDGIADTAVAAPDPIPDDWLPTAGIPLFSQHATPEPDGPRPSAPNGRTVEP